MIDWGFEWNGRTQSGPIFAKRINPLMFGWRDIVEDTRRLAALVGGLPEACDCTVGGLRGECCTTHERAFPDQCRTCAVHARQLSAHVVHVLDDTLRCLPAVQSIAHGANGELQPALREVAVGMIRLLRTMDALQAATGEFRHGCRTEHLAAVKRVTRRLVEAVEGACARLCAL